ncbi:4-hydroxy-2-oxoheptanedioate aldolase [Burkholderia sp. USMB20]|uniref:4-hydroxy-2-oxoheptanedioate aldolase n=1 Tax=Burkholderia sp. USMB20 TaxID=1571773 RepID=UPI0005CE1BF5|nr:4-hydroxy-2-oxoheptanedioate aldolase [Burkholderia sp. USMB20]TGN98715.1 4-hydroxy-2-oxoheptanedioate aldolase [Burkholderia sp. USMB20]
MRGAINSFKAALSTSAIQYGLWLGLADAYTAELCATAGFDWLLIDGEHGPNDLRSTLASLQAIASYRSHPVVRIPHGDTALIKQVLEIGATTLLVPMVDNAAQARDLVRAMRYPPAGIRGVGSGLARSSRWGADADYLRTANERMCLLVQVESAEGLANVDEIAAVDGVDGVFIGPADLAASLGRLGQADHPEVQAAIATAFERIGAAGKAAGILAVDEDRARQYLSQGVRFIAVGVDATLLAKAARSLAMRFKPELIGRSQGGGY